MHALILTKPDDTHALYVKFALEKKGHQATLWYTADVPSQQTHSFFLNQKGFAWISGGSAAGISEDLFDVVWFRRPSKPMLPEFIHPEDKKNAEQENLFFFKSLLCVVAKDAWWINPMECISTANAKVFQLKLAQTLSFNTPDTLISNDPQNIRSFIKKKKSVDVIYKTLYPVSWVEEDGVRLTYTDIVTEKDLPSDEILQVTPGIFQEAIPKAYELRITYFGEYYVATKIDSQEHPKGKMDWRYVPSGELILSSVKIPTLLDQQCQAFMSELGLVFGCFDFIVTPTGEYYFLEINEQGQFLWIEDQKEEIPMLDVFSEFLISKSKKFFWKENPERVYMKEFDEIVQETRDKAMEVHCCPLL